jgi:hypothetical protein
MTLSRQRKTDLVIEVAELLKRISADRIIHEAGGTTAGQIIRTRGPEEVAFVEALLEGTFAYTERDFQGNLRVAPRGQC